MNKYLIIMLFVNFPLAYAAEEEKFDDTSNTSNLEELDDGEMNSVTAKFSSAEGLQKNIDSKTEVINDNINTGEILNQASRSTAWDGLINVH